MDLDPSVNIKNRESVRITYDEPAACDVRLTKVFPVCPICGHNTTSWDIKWLESDGQQIAFHVKCYGVNQLIALLTLAVAILLTGNVVFVAYILYKFGIVIG